MTEPAEDFVRLAKEALINAEQTCRYHGQEFERGGWWYGEPRCDSCKQPWRVSRALAALTHESVR